MFLKARLASATLGYATRCACNRSAAFAKSSHPQRKRSDERTRTKDGQFTDAFPKLLPQDIDRVGGPSGTRTRVTDVRGRCESLTNSHDLFNSPIFLHSHPDKSHKLSRFFINDLPKT